MTRVTYKQNGDHSLISARLLANNVTVQAVLYTTSLTFEVVDTTNGAILESGTATNLAALKRFAKQTLANLGVVFTQETRNRDTNTDTFEPAEVETVVTEVTEAA